MGVEVGGGVCKGFLWWGGGGECMAMVAPAKMTMPYSATTLQKWRQTF